MIIIMLLVIKTTKISIPWKNILLVLICNLILMVVCYVIPKTLIGLIIGIIIGSSIYIVSLIRLKVLTKRDINFFSQYMDKIPILKKYAPKIVKYIEKNKEAFLTILFPYLLLISKENYITKKYKYKYFI